MSMKDKLELLGVILMGVGLVLIIIGLIVGYSEWTTLPIEKLALMALVEGLGLGIGITASGFVLFGIGLAIYLSESKKQAWNRAKKFLRI
jgi:hypothetical protein